MPEVENAKNPQPGNTKAPIAEPVRKQPRARRLLAATIGAATIQFIGGCEGLGGSAVANLMAAPRVPVAGVGQRTNPQQGSAGFQLVANLMVPPRIPQSGVSGQPSGAGVSGKAGASGAAGSLAPDIDAGLEDDAGEA